MDYKVKELDYIFFIPLKNGFKLGLQFACKGFDFLVGVFITCLHLLATLLQMQSH